MSSSNPDVAVRGVGDQHVDARVDERGGPLPASPK
jgi:hypothetical protein